MSAEPTTDNISEEHIFSGHPAVLPTLTAWIVAVLTLGLGALYFYVRAKSVHVRITSQRIVIEHGLLSKRLEQVDLYRIADYTVERPLGQRLVGTGNLRLRVLEQANAELTLMHLKTDVVALYERLRKATEQEKRRRGVRVVDFEGGAPHAHS